MRAANDEYDVANGRLSLTSGTVFTVAPLIEASGWVVEARMRWPSLDGAGEGYIEGQAQAFYEVLEAASRRDRLAIVIPF